MNFYNVYQTKHKSIFQTIQTYVFPIITDCIVKKEKKFKIVILLFFHIKCVFNSKLVLG